MHEIYSYPAPIVEFKTVKSIVGYERIRSEYQAYLSDESKISSNPFDYLFFPKNNAELAAVVREMSVRKIPLTIAGARTGLVGGCVPQEGAMVSLEFLDNIEAIYFDPDDEEWRIKAQCSVSLKSLDEMLKFKKFSLLEKSTNPTIQANLALFKKDPDSYFYPPDPTEMSASLGGSVVTNASGARTYRYGPTRAWVRGIKVLLANGEFLDIPRGKYFASPAGNFIVYDSYGNASSFNIPDYTIPKTKSTSGIFTAPQMDLIDLFIGSEGIFGIVTQVDVALLKREEKFSIVQFLGSDEQAIQLTILLRADQRVQLDFLEFYSQYALELLRERQRREPSVVGMPVLKNDQKSAIFFEINFNPETKIMDFGAIEEALSKCGASIANSWVGYEPRELDRLKVFRHLIPETVNETIAERKKLFPGLHKLGTDLAVPDQNLLEMWELYRDSCNASGLEWLAFGHIGNNHIHVNILPKNMDDLKKGLELYAIFGKKAVDFGGTISAEHGIGKIKAKFMHLMYNDEQINQMKRIKQALDPEGLFNPGDIFKI